MNHKDSMSGTDQIRDILNVLSPINLEIIDESYKHSNHYDSDQTFGSHFKINIISQAFSNVKVIDRHKMIYQLLGEKLRTHIHALSINATAPEEIK